MWMPAALEETQGSRVRWHCGFNDGCNTLAKSFNGWLVVSGFSLDAQFIVRAGASSLA
jgi:hypothetical protein